MHVEAKKVSVKGLTVYRVSLTVPTDEGPADIVFFLWVCPHCKKKIVAATQREIAVRATMHLSKHRGWERAE